MGIHMFPANDTAAIALCSLPKTKPDAVLSKKEPSKRRKVSIK